MIKAAKLNSNRNDVYQLKISQWGLVNIQHNNENAA